MLDGILRKSLYDKSSTELNKSLFWPTSLPEIMSWIQATIAAGSLIHTLHTKKVVVRFCCLVSCLAALDFIFIVYPLHFQTALPFHQEDSGSIIFGLLFAYSAVYHSHRGTSDYGTYAEFVVWVAEAYSRRYKGANDVSDTPTDPKPSEHPATSRSREASPSPASSQEEPETLEFVTGVKYEDLRGDEIRLLDILDTSGASNLRCTLNHYPIASVSNNYAALSYYWGRNNKTMVLTVNDKSAHISANLYQALTEVYSQGHKRLWVDALSVNQPNAVERNAQVRRMEEIFRKAKQVVAWLGTEDDDKHSKRVMSMLKHLGATPLPDSTNIEKPSDDDMLSFVERPYWRRVWIIQEVANAADVVFSCCGEQVTMNQLSRFVTEKLPTVDSEKRPDFPKNLNLIKELLNIRERQSSGKTLELLEALVKTDTSESTEAHDKVFGLLGVANHHRFFLHNDPDYRVNTDLMSINMTRSYFAKTKRLDIILMDPQKPEASPMPTWCPDYFHIKRANLDLNVVHYISGLEERFRLGKQGLFWTTTADSCAVEGDNFWITGPDSHVRKVKAIRIGAIDGVHETNIGDPRQVTRTSTGNNNQRRADYSFYDGIARMLLIYDHKYKKYTEASLAPNLLFTSFYKIFKALHSDDEQVNAVFTWLRENEGFKMHGRTLHDRAFWAPVSISVNWLKAAFVPDTHMTTPLDFPHLTKVISRIVQEKLHIITLEDGQVGWADPRARFDDEIFMLAGCSVPVVLRRQHPGSSKYIVIGRAYVDGFMDGERWREGEQQARRIDIVCGPVSDATGGSRREELVLYER